MNQGWQSESTDGPKGAWGLLSFALFLWLSTYLPTYLPTYLSIFYLSIYRSSVYFFDILTSKKAQNLSFLHFWLRNVLRATKVVREWVCFGHLNFQKWSEPLVFWTFWLGNVLRATTACNFASLLWPAGSAPAALASLLFDPPAPQIIGKTQCFATFLPFRASVASVLLLFLFWSSLF